MGREVTGLFQYAEWQGVEVTGLAFEPKLRQMIERLNAENAAVCWSIFQQPSALARIDPALLSKTDPGLLI